MITVQKILFLRKVDLLSELSPRELESVARQTREITVAAGTRILSEGEPGQTLYIVVGGSVKVVRADQVHATLGKGDYFGEISVLTGGPVTANIIADTDCLLLCIDQEDFHHILAESFDAVLALIRTLCGRLGQLGELREFSKL